MSVEDKRDTQIRPPMGSTFSVHVDRTFAMREKRLAVVMTSPEGRQWLLEGNWRELKPGEIYVGQYTVSAYEDSTDEILQELSNTLCREGFWPKGLDQTGELSAVRAHKDELSTIVNKLLER